MSRLTNSNKLSIAQLIVSDNVGGTSLSVNVFALNQELGLPKE